MCLLKLRVVTWHILGLFVQLDRRGLLGASHEEQHLFQERQTQGVNGDLTNSLDWFPSTLGHIRLSLLDRLVGPELGVLIDIQLCIAHGWVYLT